VPLCSMAHVECDFCQGLKVLNVECDWKFGMSRCPVVEYM
jgi:hypothetical protein